ncbi:uncharacterized protein MYCGRDRAFT_102155 [Zymoseptoria tritici IPO323]|uniref:Uncharacterized protein n=1 Tax=Zymoseptoria tritici (strain CBS 115943 / IPO323) TaxID=336722 RepID=F9WZR9_ZYMTI|nr:uncharacterized protein MYCGRDRAFT_102155 [Zymoseptoria tritici IPO323]EGP92580.1 hypothetical protein MYCGRDRAFT_102155 [Zymoseptoria tritici IPO323]
MPGESMDRSRFLKEYVLDVKTEFTIDGNSANWVPTTHVRAQKWGEEISVIDLKDEAPKGRFRHRSATMALGPDNKFLIIARTRSSEFTGTRPRSRSLSSSATVVVMWASLYSPLSQR